MVEEWQKISGEKGQDGKSLARDHTPIEERPRRHSPYVDHDMHRLPSFLPSFAESSSSGRTTRASSPILPASLPSLRESTEPS
jgi:hypothetical protein